jgi:RimJ/RimL family protein N-acetyltransferase
VENQVARLAPDLERSAHGPRQRLSAFGLRDGEPIGVQSVNATDFGVTRSAGTGSWLGLVHHGQGIGKRMRLMALHLLFHGFDAVDARTEAFDDNPESNGVTRSLGYAPNGVGVVDRKGEAATEYRYRMTREM